MSPALVGGFVTTGPPGKSCVQVDLNVRTPGAAVRRQAGSRGSAQRRPGRRGKEAGGRAGRAASSCPGLLLAPTTCPQLSCPSPITDTPFSPLGSSLCSPPHVPAPGQPGGPSPRLCRVLAITWALPLARAPSWPGAWLRRGPGIRGLLPLQLQHFCRALSLWVARCLPCC